MRTVAYSVGLLLVAACGAPSSPCASPSQRDGCVTVTIPRGATFAVALDSLHRAGVVAAPSSFATYARLRGLPGDLKSGTYELPRDAPWALIVRTLRIGRGAEVRFTVPEGLMLFEVADLARARLGIPRDSVLAAARDPEMLGELGLVGVASNVEGYLFPTTYVLAQGVGARDLVRTMTREFLAQWRLEWDMRLARLGMSRHQLVTLASIVEAEVRYPPDREFVSAVYHNRLKRGMPLQADPTVIYAHGRRVRRVWERQLRIVSPYNTYRNRGLPPGPIGQPGTASITAALYPKDVPFLYFVAQRDGKHIFSTSYAQHLQAIRQVRSRSAR